MSDLSVLIVEDDEWLAEQHARVVIRAGYRPSIALHAISAMQLIDDIHPDAIILDVLLTGNTAFALLHELQSYSDTGNIPVILCTNLASELFVEDLESYGVKQIIDKTTMVPDDIISALQRILA